MSRHQFTVPSKPQPWIRSGGSGRRYKPKRLRDYQDMVALYARGSGVREISGPIRMIADFHFDDGRWRDVDNTAKTVADALEGIAYENDKRIFEMIIRKHMRQDDSQACLRVESMDVDYMSRGRNDEILEAIELLTAHGLDRVAGQLLNLKVMG